VLIVTGTLGVYASEVVTTIIGLIAGFAAGLIFGRPSISSLLSRRSTSPEGGKRSYEFGAGRGGLWRDEDECQRAH
jgi:hypothetical protein